MKRSTLITKQRNERSEIIMGAVLVAYGAKHSFNVDGLAHKLNMTPNRHFRAVLNDLVKRGVLCKVKLLHADSRYRTIYYANGTDVMDGFKVS